MTYSQHYKFSAYNTQSIYGYGSKVEAQQYCEWLNTGRGYNHFYFEFIPKGEITEDIKAEMVMMSDALAERRKEGLTPF